MTNPHTADTPSALSGLFLERQDCLPAPGLSELGLGCVLTGSVSTCFPRQVAGRRSQQETRTRWVGRGQHPTSPVSKWERRSASGGGGADRGTDAQTSPACSAGESGHTGSCPATRALHQTSPAPTWRQRSLPAWAHTEPQLPRPSEGPGVQPHAVHKTAWTCQRGIFAGGR